MKPIDIARTLDARNLFRAGKNAVLDVGGNLSALVGGGETGLEGQIYARAHSVIGKTRYKMGGKDDTKDSDIPTVLDCSGFSRWVLIPWVTIPHGARNQCSNAGGFVIHSADDTRGRTGLVWFAKNGSTNISDIHHVAVLCGDRVLDASTDDAPPDKQTLERDWTSHFAYRTKKKETVFFAPIGNIIAKG